MAMDKLGLYNESSSKPSQNDDFYNKKLPRNNYKHNKEDKDSDNKIYYPKMWTETIGVNKQFLMTEEEVCIKLEQKREVNLLIPRDKLENCSDPSLLQNAHRLGILRTDTGFRIIALDEEE